MARCPHIFLRENGADGRRGAGPVRKGRDKQKVHPLPPKGEYPEKECWRSRHPFPPVYTGGIMHPAQYGPT